MYGRRSDVQNVVHYFKDFKIQHLVEIVSVHVFYDDRCITFVTAKYILVHFRSIYNDLRIAQLPLQ